MILEFLQVYIIFGLISFCFISIWARIYYPYATVDLNGQMVKTMFNVVILWPEYLIILGLSK